MLKKTVTYTDFDGVERTETCHFHLTKAEMIEYDAAYVDRGGIMAYLQYLVEEEKTNELIVAFKDLILRSYGERDSTGRFVKSQVIRDSFMATEAYSEIFMEIVSSEKNATDFINGLFANLVNQAKKETNVSPIPAPLG